MDLRHLLLLLPSCDEEGGRQSVRDHEEAQIQSQMRNVHVIRGSDEKNSVNCALGEEVAEGKL